MTAEEAENVIIEWNKLHSRVLTFLDLGDKDSARKVVEQMQQLPLEAARNVVYDDAQFASLDEQVSTGGQVFRRPGADELDGSRKGEGR